MSDEPRDPRRPNSTPPGPQFFEDEPQRISEDGLPTPAELDFTINPLRAWHACKRYAEMGLVVRDEKSGRNQWVPGALEKIRAGLHAATEQPAGMTVGELIAALSEVDPDLKVWIAMHQQPNSIHSATVTRVRPNDYLEVVLS